MPVTLEQAKLNTQDALQIGVIDEFAKSNWILNNIIFDDAVSPTGGGATLTYAYTRLITQPTADFREFNAEYTPQEVTKKRVSVDLKPFGGSFKIDRVLASMGGIANEVSLQISQKVKASQALFNDTVINGDTAQNSKAFDGLEKALAGSSTEFNGGGSAIDLSTSAQIDANYKEFLDMLDEFIGKLDGTPSALLGNYKLIAKIKAIGRRCSMYQTTTDSFGRMVETYGGIPLIDMGDKAGTAEAVVKTDSGSGETSLYAVRLGLDAFHAVSLAGQNPVNIWLPDFTNAGAVKTGEVEMVAAVALKSSKSAGVMRKIKVQ